MKSSFIFFILWICFFNQSLSQGSWEVIPNAPANGRYDDIYFINDSVGFVGQLDIIHKTIDKGNTWNQISTIDSLDIYIRSIEFINDTIGFVGSLYSTFPLTGNLYKTTDGGYSWSLLQNMQIDIADGICGMAHFGNRLVAVGTYFGPAWFYRTDDFGLTWMKVDLSNIMDGLVDCYMISNDTILISGIADSTNNYNGCIAKSTDGGLTWTLVYLSNTPYMDFCWKMFFRPGGLGIASLESYGPILAIARTTDFGDTWSTILVDTTLQIQGDLGGIGLLNDTLGWVCNQGNSGTWETQDGGLTWSKDNSSPVWSGDRMVVVDSLTALMAGNTIYRYVLGTVGIAEPYTFPIRNKHSLNIYPIPGNDKITIDAIAVNNTFGLLDVIEASGKMVKRIARQPFVKGKNTFQISVADLPAGNYSAIWHNNEGKVSKTFSVIH